MKYIMKWNGERFFTFDKVADEIADKMAFAGSWDGHSVPEAKGVYHISKQLYKANVEPKAKNVESEPVVEKKEVKQPKAHRKAKDIRAANQKHKRG